MKAFCKRLRQNGKHGAAVQIAVVRKSIQTTHSLYKNDERYDLQKYLQNQAKKKNGIIIKKGKYSCFRGLTGRLAPSKTKCASATRPMTSS
ncbi:hypothetical protein [Hydrogenimonas sp.]